MRVAAKITKVGNSSALIIPKGVMERFNLAQGEVVSLSEVPNGFVVTPYDEKKNQQLDVAREIMRENRNMLKKLAE